jgi:metal-responsive CopG/Arc/MetJ family transcriptional regulator
MTTRTIQMTLDDALLAEVDVATRELHTTRSALIRSALARFLDDLRIRRLERQHREAYERMPQTEDEVAFWEGIESWGPE